MCLSIGTCLPKYVVSQQNYFQRDVLFVGNVLINNFVQTILSVLRHSQLFVCDERSARKYKIYEIALQVASAATEHTQLLYLLTNSFPFPLLLNEH